MSIYFQALAVWIIYSFGTKYLFVQSLFWKNILTSYIPQAVASALFGVIFLYFFSHENFFKFAKEIEKKEKKKEVKLIHKFLHIGKITVVFLVAVLSGPLLSALVARFILRRVKYKYWIVFFASMLGGVFWLAVAKGGFHIFNSFIW